MSAFIEVSDDHVVLVQYVFRRSRSSLTASVEKLAVLGSQFLENGMRPGK